MSTSKIISNVTVSNFAELAHELARINVHMPNGPLSAVPCFNQHGNPLTVRVIVDEEDGKSTFNINIE